MHARIETHGDVCAWLIGLPLLWLTMTACALAEDEMAASQIDRDGPASRIETLVTVSLDDLTAKIREWVVGNGGGRSHSERRRTDLGLAGAIVSTVTITPRVDALSLRTDQRKKRLTVTVPLIVSSRHQKSGVLASVFLAVNGCGTSRQFDLQAVFGFATRNGKPLLTRERVAVRNHGHKCSIDLGLIRGKNVSETIRVGAEAKAKGLLKGVATSVTRLLTKDVDLSSVTACPVVFDNVMSLGLDNARFEPLDVEVGRQHLGVKGLVHGWPRLQFVNSCGAWKKTAVPRAVSVPSESPRLGVLALFPRDRALLPADQRRERDGFWVNRVPGHDDMAVIEYTRGGATEHLLWVSGRSRQPPGEAIVLDEPMTGVLDRIVAWLDARTAPEARAEFARLRSQVSVFRDMLLRFQADTELTLGNGANLMFSDLGISLTRAWVTPRAIFAEIVLTGQAQIRYRLAL